MNVGTGEFAALTAQAEQAEFLRRRLEQFDEDAAQRVEVVFHYIRGYLDAKQGAEMRPGRHARPRRTIPGYLRLVGSAQ